MTVSVNYNNLEGSRGFVGLETVEENSMSGIYMNGSIKPYIISKNPKAGFEPEILIDIIGKIPTEVAVYIFALLKTELPNLALVSKKFTQIADSSELSKIIFPHINAFGEKQYKQYGLKIIGDIPLLPRRVYGDLEQDKTRRIILLPKEFKALSAEKPFTEDLRNELTKKLQEMLAQPHAPMTIITPKEFKLLYAQLHFTKDLDTKLILKLEDMIAKIMQIYVTSDESDSWRFNIHSAINDEPSYWICRGQNLNSRDIWFSPPREKLDKMMPLFMRTLRGTLRLPSDLYGDPHLHCRVHYLSRDIGNFLWDLIPSMPPLEFRQ